MEQNDDARGATVTYGHQPILPRLEILDQSTSSKPDNFRVSPATPLPNGDADDTWSPIDNDWDADDAWNAIDNESARHWDSALADPSKRSLDSTATTIDSDLDAVMADWSGRGAHVDFQSHEEVPLVQSRFLGHGSMGSVFETNVQGHTFAWKRRYCRRRIGEAERKEIEILKKVSHHHIIKLAASYTHRQFLGLLLYPVAVCDLATLLEDLESVLKDSDRDLAREQRMTALGHPPSILYSDEIIANGSMLIFQRMGCIISAVEYLHSQSIRHKDLKPSNILLAEEKLWLADFGTATDFSDQTVSTTEGVERGTPKYFAPEVAAYEGSGRPADIFSLGCVLLEMCMSQQVAGLEQLRVLRSHHDKSFQANLKSIHHWLSRRPPTLHAMVAHQILYQVGKMLAREPEMRPTIGHVKEAFAWLDIGQDLSEYEPLFGICCRKLFVSKDRHGWLVENERTRAEERVRSEMQKTIDDLRKERDQLEHRANELQQTVDQQLWSLNAWVQRDAVRLNDNAQQDVRIDFESAPRRDIGPTILDRDRNHYLGVSKSCLDEWNGQNRTSREKTPEERELINEKRQALEIPHICLYCEYVAKTKSDLDTHVETCLYENVLPHIRNMDNGSASTHSIAFPTSPTTRTLRKLHPLPPESFSRPPSPLHKCRTCGIASQSTEEFTSHTPHRLERLDTIQVGNPTPRGPGWSIEWQHLPARTRDYL